MEAKAETPVGSGIFEYIIDLEKVAEYKKEFDDAAIKVKVPIDNFITNVNNNIFNTHDIKGLNEVRDHIKGVVENVKNVNDSISNAINEYSNYVEATEGEISGKIAGLNDFVASSDGQWGIIDSRVKPILDGDLNYNIWLATKGSPDGFVNKYLGQSIDTDGNGVWCFDVINKYMQDMGYPSIKSPNGYASGIWNIRNNLSQYFEVIPISEIKNHGGLQNGDFAIWGTDYNMTPQSHVGMYYNGRCFNQGKNSSCHYTDLDFYQAKGILRPKKWKA